MHQSGASFVKTVSLGFGKVNKNREMVELKPRSIKV
jgi:hypothetical protein